MSPWCNSRLHRQVSCSHTINRSTQSPKVGSRPIKIKDPTNTTLTLTQREMAWTYWPTFRSACLTQRESLECSKRSSPSGTWDRFQTTPVKNKLRSKATRSSSPLSQPKSSSQLSATTTEVSCTPRLQWTFNPQETFPSKMTKPSKLITNLCRWRMGSRSRCRSMCKNGCKGLIRWDKWGQLLR